MNTAHSQFDQYFQISLDNFVPHDMSREKNQAAHLL